MGKQYKLHITPTEQKWWGVKGGSRVEVFDIDKGKIAIQICYDIEFPEVTRIAVEQGAQIIFVPFCRDERYSYLRVRYCAQARCVENLRGHRRQRRQLAQGRRDGCSTGLFSVAALSSFFPALPGINYAGE